MCTTLTLALMCAASFAAGITSNRPVMTIMAFEAFATAAVAAAVAYGLASCHIAVYRAFAYGVETGQAACHRPRSGLRIVE